jgi:hypothetical protein
MKRSRTFISGFVKSKRVKRYLVVKDTRDHDQIIICATESKQKADKTASVYNELRNGERYKVVADIR